MSISISKFALTGNKLIAELYLKHQGFTYIAIDLLILLIFTYITKHRERVQ